MNLCCWKTLSWETLERTSELEMGWCAEPHPAPWLTCAGTVGGSRWRHSVYRILDLDKAFLPVYVIYDYTSEVQNQCKINIKTQKEALCSWEVWVCVFLGIWYDYDRNKQTSSQIGVVCTTLTSPPAYHKCLKLCSEGQRYTFKSCK